MLTSERILLWAVRVGTFLLLFTPLVILPSLFFPFITGKNFFFRILTEVIFIAWAALAVLRPEYRPRFSYILASFSAFIAILGVATVFGVDPYHSFWSNFERMEGYITHLHVLMLFFALGHTFQKERDWSYIFHTSLAVSAIAAAYGLFQGLGIISMLGAGRPYATFGNSIYFAVYLMFHLFIITAFFIVTRQTTLRVVYGSLFILEALVFFFAASRGAFIGFTVGAVCIALASIFLSKNKLHRGVVLSAIACFVIFITFIRLYPSASVIQRSDLVSRLASIEISKLGEDSRVMIWNIAWRAFQERPILGWGPENFIIPYAKYYNPNLYGNEAWFDRAHNMLLEWLVASGVLGFIAYMSIFVSVGLILRALVKKNKMTAFLAILVGGVFIAYIIQNIFVFDNIVTYLMVVCILAWLHSFTVGQRTAPTRSVQNPQRLLAASSIIVVGCLLAIVANAKPFMAAVRIIDFLGAFPQQKNAGEIAKLYDQVVGYGTFGTSEARERLADTLVQISPQVQSTPSPQFIRLLDKSVSELELEAERQPYVARYPIFLGKLYTLKTTFQGIGMEKAEENYRKALEIAPMYIQSNLGLAELYLISGKNNLAIESADRAFTLAQRSPGMFYAVLSTHLLANDAPGATRVLHDFLKTTDFKPDQKNFGKEELGLIAQRSARVRDSHARLAFLEELDRWASPTALLYLITAETYAEVGDKANATTYALRAQEVDPNQKAEVSKFLQSIEHVL